MRRAFRRAGRQSFHRVIRDCRKFEFFRTLRGSGERAWIGAPGSDHNSRICTCRPTAGHHSVWHGDADQPAHRISVVADVPLAFDAGKPLRHPVHRTVPIRCSIATNRVSTSAASSAFVNASTSRANSVASLGVRAPLATAAVSAAMAWAASAAVCSAGRANATGRSLRGGTSRSSRARRPIRRRISRRSPGCARWPRPRRRSGRQQQGCLVAASVRSAKRVAGLPRLVPAALLSA